jgi:predicted GNAT family N-acyltransferase
MTSAEFRVRRSHWESDAPSLRAVREAVFVREQKVPAELEWDGMDARCAHVLAEAAGEPVGTGRLLPDGHIGRMAVIASWRGRGVGSAILRQLIQIARERGLQRVVLHAQTQAKAFYERHGFHTEGAEFMEAGIVHISMTRDLSLPGNSVHHRGTKIRRNQFPPPKRKDAKES